MQEQTTMTPVRCSRHAFAASFAALLLFLFLSFAAGTISSHPQAAANSEYLPLAPGKHWVLRSPSTSKPIDLRVADHEHGAYQLEFNNPWVNSVMHLEPAGQQILLRALSMGGQTKPFPDPPVYFDFGLAEGKQWSNSIGAMTILSRHRTVQAGHTYHDCIEIKEVDSKGSQLFWTFAPGVGFVQFGEGKGAFVLDEKSSDLTGSSTASIAASEKGIAPPPPDNATHTPVAGRGAWMALAANPAANQPFDAKNVNERFEQSVLAGVSYVYLSPKWSELEPQKGKYHFQDLDFQIGQAQQHDLPIICNVRVVDTNQRSMPRDLEKLSFDDLQVRERLTSLLSALMPRFQGRARFMLVGNEIDAYFTAHKSEITGYRNLYLAAAAQITRLQPGTPVSTTSTFDGIDKVAGFLKPIFDATDFFSVTYYPLTPEFIVRDPGSVSGDFAKIKDAARSKKVLLQEVGYPSSPINKSSEEKQAAMCRAILRELRSNKDVFIGAYWFTMSDFPDSVVDDLSKYYQLAGADRFRAFLGSLGMFDQRGNPKKSWQAFSEEAPLLSK
jgi:hypothetical protein